MPSKILIISGPVSGDRIDRLDVEDSVPTLDVIREACEKHCVGLKADLDFRQSDDHRVLLEWLEKDCEEFDGVILNPAVSSKVDSGAGPFYASAMQLIADSGKPAIEVRLDNIYRSGEKKVQQQHKPECDMGFVCGFGLQGYILAINALAQRFATVA